MDIKRVIKEHGLTVEQVAIRMGVTKGGLSQNINGNPTAEKLQQIANAIGCEVGDFFNPNYHLKSSDSTLVCPHCGKELHIKIE
jgi:transcriptional regulator with XRE-family HTH domain